MTRSDLFTCLILTLLACLPTTRVAAETEPDPITASVAQAEQSFRESVLKEKADLSQQINAVMEREIQRAIGKGDLDELESLQAQLKAFQADGTAPDVLAIRSHVQSYKKKLTRFGDSLVKAYELATQRYTQARDVDNARLMQDKINWTRPTAALDTFERRGQMYALFLEEKFWTDAQAHCESLGGYLVCLSDQSEHRFIMEVVLADKNIIFWVGASDAKTEGDWKWLDGSDDYWPWRKGDPNNANNAEHYAGIDRRGRLVDMWNKKPGIAGYVCEWDVAPTRETIYKTPAQARREAEAIDTLKTATVKHNQQIVAERDRLQAAILQAKDEETISTAQAGYNEKVTSIKQAYVNQLEQVLTRAIDEDQLEIAGNIKTQILRVERQLAKLGKDDTKPALPEPDAGGIDPKPDDNKPDPADPSDDTAEETQEEPDDTGSFFGLPLE